MPGDGPGSPLFEARRRETAARVEELRAHLTRARLGGPEESRRKHAERGKLLPRQRVERLLDPGAPILELSPLAAHGMYSGEVPGGGILSAIGTVGGRRVIVMANDATVKGGTYHPVSLKKHLRAQEIARENRLPCVYMVDSGGAFLPLQSEMFADREHGGRMFYNQARMSRQGIPQIAVVMGSCTAGGAYVPAMSDEVVIVRNQGTIFLAGPPLVLAATGERVSAEELGGGDVHARSSGVADHLAEDDEHALELARAALGNLASRDPFASSPSKREGGAPPLHDPEELYGLIGAKGSMDARAILARLLDGSALAEFESHLGPEVVAAHARLEGRSIGILACVAPLTPEGALKAARFARLCREPLLVASATSDAPGDAGRSSTRAYAELLTALAQSAVPRVTLIAGPSSGAAHLALAGRAQGARFLFAWPTASYAQALGSEPIGALEATARILDDGLLDPAQTRSTLALAFDAAGSLAEVRH